MIDQLKVQAEQLANRGRLQEAEVLYERICQFAPHQGHSWIRLAQLQFELERLENCRRSLDYALRLEPLAPSALLLGTVVFLETGHYERVVQLADALLNLNDGNRLSALTNKSTALLRLGRCAEALAIADAALALDDRQPNLYSNRGSALFGLGRHEEALASYERALALRPGNGIVLINQAAVLRALQHPTEALAAAEAALAGDPRSPAALLNHAAALMDLTRNQEALAVLDRLLEQKPDHAKALQNRFLTLLRLGRGADAQTALQLLRKAGHSVADLILAASELSLQQAQPLQALAWIDQGLSWYPDHPRLLQGRVALLLAREHYPKALATARRLVELTEPGQLTARLAVAAAFNANGRFQEALALLEQLPASAQDHWQLHAKRGESLAGLDRFNEARASFALADDLEARAFRASFYDGPFQIRPTDSVPPPVTPELVRINFEFRRLEHGDWEDYDSRIAAIRHWTEESLARGEPSPLLPFRALFLPLSSELRLAIARREAERLTQSVAGLPRAMVDSQPIEADQGRLKIGYVSADFRQHPTAHLMRGLFRCHDRNRFEIFGYALRGDDGSSYYRQIQQDCDWFVDLSSLDNAAAARRIQSDRIHILVDLMTYTNFARPEIFALRSAPVQVNWLGFPGSSGAAYMDYLLVDPVVLPPEQAAYCVEQPVFLPECYQVNDRWQEIAATQSQRRDHGLPERGVIFCCFNQIQKIEPILFAVWMDILGQVPGAVLWLYSESEEAQARLRATAATLGIGGERLIFAGRLPKSQHLARHRLADLFLDTRLYNAHTTASDALWAGVPVLTCLGETFPARVAASLLQAVGLPELITQSLDGYAELAVRLALQPAELRALREKLARNRLRMPLFDTERFARHLERAYAMMWERHAQGLPPASLRVEPLPDAP